ncbi:MAG: ACT domain-containing protein [Candidatus Latescibacterota bacterium]|nr:ACT domain-containing protein [Candidatus Latescibacterota bacterium]
MSDRPVTRTWVLTLLPDELSVCRLDEKEPVPVWVTDRGGFWSMTRRDRELSVVCVTASVPASIQHESGWRCLVIDEVIPFAEIGVLAALTSLLAAAEVSVFALSTYETDALMVKQDRLKQVTDALESAGHQVRGHQ